MNTTTIEGIIQSHSNSEIVIDEATTIINAALKALDRAAKCDLRVLQTQTAVAELRATANAFHVGEITWGELRAINGTVWQFAREEGIQELVRAGLLEAAREAADYAKFCEAEDDRCYRKVCSAGEQI